VNGVGHLGERVARSVSRFRYLTLGTGKNTHSVR
jgi:hypothetical protein